MLHTQTNHRTVKLTLNWLESWDLQTFPKGIRNILSQWFFLLMHLPTIICFTEKKLLSYLVNEMMSFFLTYIMHHYSLRADWPPRLLCVEPAFPSTQQLHVPHAVVTLLYFPFLLSAASSMVAMATAAWPLACLLQLLGAWPEFCCSIQRGAYHMHVHLHQWSMFICSYVIIWPMWVHLFKIMH